MEPNKTPYELDISSVKAQDSSITGTLINTATKAIYSLQLFGLADSTFHLKISEMNPIKPRPEVEHVLVSEPVLEK